MLFCPALFCYTPNLGFLKSCSFAGMPSFAVICYANVSPFKRLWMYLWWHFQLSSTVLHLPPADPHRPGDSWSPHLLPERSSKILALFYFVFFNIQKLSSLFVFFSPLYPFTTTSHAQPPPYPCIVQLGPTGFLHPPPPVTAVTACIWVLAKHFRQPAASCDVTQLNEWKMTGCLLPMEI